LNPTHHHEYQCEPADVFEHDATDREKGRRGEGERGRGGEGEKGRRGTSAPGSVKHFV
jgi:hypothetical protein